MYAIHYDPVTGQCLSITLAQYGSDGDLIVDNYPSGTLSYWYVVDGRLVYRAPDETEEAGGLEDRGISLGGGGSNAYADTSASEDTNERTARALTNISSGGVLTTIVLTKADWAVNQATGKYVFAIASESITPSTVLQVNGVNREVLTAHIYWSSDDELLTFETASIPSDDVQIYGMLEETGDTWQAKGVIEAWPGAGLVSQRYRESLYHAEGDTGWPFVLTARGTENDSKTILTKVGFADANLLFATPEWTGNTHVMIPHVYVQESTKRLCYTLTNLSDDEVEISEVAIRLMYNGVISNLETDTGDSGSIDGYIDEIDIDELDQ